MERLVTVQRDQQIASRDLLSIGEFGRASLDRIVREAIEPGLKFTGFTAVASGVATVTVAAGALYADGKVYFRADEGGVELDLIGSLPAIAKRIVALVCWGQTIDTAVEPRTFLLDAVTRQTEARAVATESRRYANIDKVVGGEFSDPQAPAVDANMLPFALVTLTPAGIESIQMLEINRLVSVRMSANELLEIGIWRQQVGSVIETLQTELLGISSKLQDTMRTSFGFELARDLASLKETADLPDAYTNYGADHFLDAEECDLAHPDWLARVEEGIRFPPAAEREAQIALLNTDDAKVKVQSEFLLPAYTEYQRVNIAARDSELSVSQYEHQTMAFNQKLRTMTRWRYGPWFAICTNSSFWKSGKYDWAKGTFTRAGAVYEVQFVEQHASGDPAQSIKRLRQVWVDTYTEPYWDIQKSVVNISGSIVSQTWLNTQESYLTAVGLYFTRKGAAGDVRVLVTETHADGSPNPRAVVAQTVLPHASIKIWPAQTKVPLEPTLLKRGARYAITLVTTGGHYIALAHNNKFAQGSLFQSTDGAWFQGDLTRDMSFALHFAKFKAPLIDVQLQPLELQNGIANVDILTDTHLPEGTRITWQARINNRWVSLEDADTDPLLGLHPLLQFRAVLEGTTDLMPGFGLGTKGRVQTHRPRSDYTAISEVQTTPAPVTQVQVDLRLENWVAARHTIACTLLTGAGYATVEAADTVETILPAGSPDATTIKRFTFNVPALSSFKIRVSGTTNNVLVTYHVAKRQHVTVA